MPQGTDKSGNTGPKSSWPSFLFCVTQARSEDARSSPSQRPRGEDSTSTGELQPMPTSPGGDLQSPVAQDVLFSSPPQMHSSGACLKI